MNINEDRAGASALARWAPAAVRLAVGYGFLAHGVAKATRGPDAFAAILAAIGVPAPHVMSWATIAIEIAGGIAVLLGGFVRLASVPMIAVLVVAALTVHLPYGFSSVKLTAVTDAGAQFGPPGYEVDVLYIAALLTLALGGSGPFSIDGILERRRRGADGVSTHPGSAASAR